MFLLIPLAIAFLTFYPPLPICRTLPVSIVSNHQRRQSAIKSSVTPSLKKQKTWSTLQPYVTVCFGKNYKISRKKNYGIKFSKNYSLSAANHHRCWYSESTRCNEQCKVIVKRESYHLQIMLVMCEVGNIGQYLLSQIIDSAQFTSVLYSVLLLKMAAYSCRNTFVYFF